MGHILKNDNLEVHIDFPQENYHFPRFDQTGKIVKVVYKGNLFTSVESTNHTDSNLIGKGFYNEFGMESSIGFHEVSIHQWFPKIGVGILQKENSEYDFLHSYPQKPAQFIINAQKENIQLTCTSLPCNGYDYKLSKKISLLHDGFQIQYQLFNKGLKNIKTAEYVHNFLAINKDHMGSDYELRFPFEFRIDQFEKFENEEDKVMFNKNLVSFSNTPKKPFFFSYMNGDQSVKATWELRNLKHGVGMRESGDFLTKKVNLWGWTHVVCPEIFFEFDLQPKHGIEWSRTFKFFEFE